MENCQGWTIRVLRQLQRAGIVSAEWIAFAEKMQEGVQELGNHGRVICIYQCSSGSLGWSFMVLKHELASWSLQEGYHATVVPRIACIST